MIIGVEVRTQDSRRDDQRRLSTRPELVSDWPAEERALRALVTSRFAPFEIAPAVSRALNVEPNVCGALRSFSFPLVRSLDATKYRFSQLWSKREQSVFPRPSLVEIRRGNNSETRLYRLAVLCVREYFSIHFLVDISSGLFSYADLTLTSIPVDDYLRQGRRFLLFWIRVLAEDRSFISVWFYF